MEPISTYTLMITEPSSSSECLEGALCYGHHGLVIKPTLDLGPKGL